MTTPAEGNDPPNPTKVNLDGFLVRPENHSAVRAIRVLARAVLAGKRSPFCPLVLHGPPGTGKTHLTSAVLRAITGGPGEVIARVVATGEMIHPDEGTGFRDHDLQTCDLLILEDVHHLPSRSAAAVCELIDHRVARRKALVITACAGPARLAHLSRRLTSRLGAGLVVQLQPLGNRSRKAVLSATAKARNVRLTPDALDWLAAQHGNGMRATLGLLQNLAHAAPGFPGPLDRKAVEKILSGTGQPTSTRDDPGAILKRVAAAFNVTEKELLGTSRLRTVLVPRQVAMFLARELTGLSLPRIGAFFAGRDHTTVLHACRKVEADLGQNATLAATVRQLRTELG